MPSSGHATPAQTGFGFSVKKSGEYHKAAVASAHPLASEAGMLMIKQGGNAFDAAVATQLALAVVYPGAGNLGGGGLLLGRRSDGRIVAIEFRERAPGAAHADMYLDSAGNVVPGLSTTGRLAAGVPGTVAGIFHTLQYCRLPIKVLAAPAINFARNGFALTSSEAASLNAHRVEFEKNNSGPIAFVKASAWGEGDTLRQPELAATIQRIVSDGEKDFYQGKTAALIIAEMKRGNGIMQSADLKDYKAVERKPVEFSYRGVRVLSFPPPSSGGILLGQMLGMTELFPIAGYGFQSARTVHLMTEIERRAYADRAEHLGDPDFFRVPQHQLLDTAYLRARIADFDPAHATPSKLVQSGQVAESKQTTHISIADGEGNCVSLTTTLNDVYGCKTVVQGAGFFLNNEMDDFSVKPGVPNLYGAVGGTANAIEPGKRMLSSMAPTILMKDNKPFLIVGTPGGTTIPTSVYQTIVNVIDFKMTLSDAVNKPKFHHQWLPDQIELEEGFDKSTAHALETMGHPTHWLPSIGRVEAIECNGNLLSAVADGRGDDSVAGF